MPEASLFVFVRAGLVKVNYNSNRPSPTWLRFWSRVDRDGPPHPTLGNCWVWRGPLDNHGYGAIGDNRRIRKAHRLAWELQNGQIVPPGLHVLHRCDNPACVRRDHLFLGTHQDNMRDCQEKGRHRHGMGPGKAHYAKLTAEQVREIRSRYRWRDPVNGAKALGREFGVNESTVRSVVSRRNWVHIA
jgi:hypothetical protein